METSRSKDKNPFHIDDLDNDNPIASSEDEDPPAPKTKNPFAIEPSLNSEKDWYCDEDGELDFDNNINSASDITKVKKIYS